MARVDELAALPCGWVDDAPPPTSEAIEVTRQVLGVIRALAYMNPTKLAPQITPTYGGGTQIEWHEQGWTVEVEISATGRIETWVADVRNRPTTVFSYPPDSEASE
jgi:hypothetical protein